MLRRVLIFLCLTVAIGLLVTCGQRPVTPMHNNDGTLPVISVKLPGPTSQLTGMEAAGATSSADGTQRIATPSRLTIELPDGRKGTVEARSCTVMSERGIVSGIYFTRPLKPASFKMVVADLKTTLAELKITPNANMKEQMAGWGEDVPGTGSSGSAYVFKTAWWCSQAFP